MPDVSAGREFHYGASAAVIYDTNVARASSTIAQQRGVDPEDTLFRPQIDVSIVQPLGRQVVFLKGFGGYEIYRKNDQLNRRRVNLTGGYGAQLGFCQPMLFGSYAAQQSDLETIDDLVVNNLVETVNTSAAVACSRGVGPAGMLMVQRTEVQNSVITQRPADTTAESATLNVGYERPSLGRFSVVYVYSNNEFPNRIIPGRPIGDGFQSTSYFISAERDIGSRLTASAQAGRTMVKREFAPAGEPLKVRTTVYSGSVRYQIGSRLQLRGEASRLVKPSVRAGKLYDITTGGSLEAQYDLGTRFQISLGHAIQDVDSNADTAVILAPGARPVVTHSRTNSTYGAVQYRQSEIISLTLDVRHQDRETDVPSLNYTSTRVGLVAKVAF